MEEALQTQAVMEVTSATEHEATPGLITVSGPMLMLTWLSFIIVAVLLYKLAWKPILTALDIRERGIRKALEDAERARQEAATSEARNRQLIRDAELEAQRIINEARAAAEADIRQLREDGERRARELTEEARRDITGAAEQARQSLRRETSELAILLASRILAHNVDSGKNRELIQDALREVSTS